MFNKTMFSKILVVIALVGGTALAQPQEHNLPIEVQLRIYMLNSLAYVKTETFAAFVKANSPALHDRVTASVVSAIREKSAQNAADFAAAAGISVEALQTAEQEGTGLDRIALEKIWGLGLLSVEDLFTLRREVVLAALSDEEKAHVKSRASTIVKELLNALKYIQVSLRDEGSAQLPAAEGILRKMRDDYDVLLQLSEEHYPQIKEFISPEAFSDELIAQAVTASKVTDQLRHNVAFMFFHNEISKWKDQQAADKPANQ